MFDSFLTDQEKQAFVNKVKGKKIKLNTWDDCYFIPNGEWTGSVFFGDLFLGNVLLERDTTFEIRAGFINNPKPLQHHWEFVNSISENPCASKEIVDTFKPTSSFSASEFCKRAKQAYKEKEALHDLLVNTDATSLILALRRLDKPRLIELSRLVQTVIYERVED